MSPTWGEKRLVVGRQGLMVPPAVVGRWMAVAGGHRLHWVTLKKRRLNGLQEERRGAKATEVSPRSYPRGSHTRPNRAWAEGRGGRNFGCMFDREAGRVVFVFPKNAGCTRRGGSSQQLSPPCSVCQSRGEHGLVIPAKCSPAATTLDLRLFTRNADELKYLLYISSEIVDACSADVLYSRWWACMITV
ncbi:unnamed protein product [Scytosiphon promiscuus]